MQASKRSITGGGDREIVGKHEIHDHSDRKSEYFIRPTARDKPRTRSVSVPCNISVGSDRRPKHDRKIKIVLRLILHGVNSLIYLKK